MKTDQEIKDPTTIKKTNQKKANKGKKEESSIESNEHK